MKLLKTNLVFWFVGLLVGAVSAHADTCSTKLMPAFAPYQATQLCATFVGTATISGALTFTTSGPLIQSTKIAVAVGAASTPNMELSNAGLNFLTAGMGENLPAGQVFTPATNLTPVAGARLLANRLGAVATAAPTLAVVFAQPTASVGKVVRIYNQGANPLLILPEDGAINATGALTPFSCAAGKICTGWGLSTTQMIFGAQ